MGRRYNTEIIREKFKERGYTLLSEYTKPHDLLEYICPKGHKHKMCWANFQQGQSCPECAYETRGSKRRLKYEDIKKSFEEVGYKLLSATYTRSDKKLEYECDKGHQFLGDKGVTWDNFKKGRRCPICSTESTKKKLRKNFNEIEEAFKEEGYTLLTKDSEYLNSSQPLSFICPNNHKHSISWDAFKQGQRCRICNNRSGEEKISSYLNEININFIREYKFEDCIYKTPLRFDFYIPSYNLVIEYDGQQHFFPVDFSGRNKERANKEFELNKIRDGIKNDYCKENNINILRISYLEFDNIKEIIYQKINELKTFND